MAITCRFRMSTFLLGAVLLISWIYVTSDMPCRRVGGGNGGEYTNVLKPGWGEAETMCAFSCPKRETFPWSATEGFLTGGFPYTVVDSLSAYARHEFQSSSCCAPTNRWPLWKQVLYIIKYWVLSWLILYFQRYRNDYRQSLRVFIQVKNCPVCLVRNDRLCTAVTSLRLGVRRYPQVQLNPVNTDTHRDHRKCPSLPPLPPHIIDMFVLSGVI